MDAGDDMINIGWLASVLLMCKGCNFYKRFENRSNVADKIDELLLVSDEGIDDLLGR